MSARRFFGSMLVTTLLSTLRGQGDDSITPGIATNTVPITNAISNELSLTNKAMFAIAKLRGVEPAKIKLRPGARPNGPFEIDIAGVRDCKGEAEALSKELGDDAAVIFEHVSADGATRTNWSFRGGMGRQITAPAGPTGLGPNAKRMYIWPQSSIRPMAPTGIRVRATADK